MNLTINNFKCFEEQSISFGKLTLLAGSNSVGKSTVVQSLLLLRAAIERIQSLGINKTSFELIRSSNPGISVSLNGPFMLNLGSSREVLNRNAIQEIIKFTIILSELDRKYFEVSFGIPDVNDSYSLTLRDIQGIKTHIMPDISLGSKYFYYLNAERIGPRIRHDVNDLTYPHSGWQGEYAIQMIGSNSNKTSKIDPKRCLEGTPNLLEQSRLWLEMITPGTSLGNASLIQGIKSAEADFSKSKPTNVGFGISYVLPIIVNGLIAEKNSMFIVENPEAHLHPLGQSQIGKFLAKIAASGVNVVIETHSEHVINGIRIASLRNTIDTKDVIINYFSRVSDSKIDVKPIHINDSGDLTSYPKGFFDQEQRDLAEIIREKRKRIAEKL